MMIWKILGHILTAVVILVVMGIVMLVAMALTAIHKGIMNDDEE